MLGEVPVTAMCEQEGGANKATFEVSRAVQKQKAIVFRGVLVEFKGVS